MSKSALSRPVEVPNSFVLWIEGNVGKRHGVYCKDIAREIGLKPSSFTKRMETGRFYYSEMVKIFKLLKATDEEIIRLMKGA